MPAAFQPSSPDTFESDSATINPGLGSTPSSTPDLCTLRGSGPGSLQRQDAAGKSSAEVGQPVDLFPAGFPLPEAGSKRVGVCFERLIVEGSGGTGKLVESFPSSLINSFNIWNFVSRASVRVPKPPPEPSPALTPTLRLVTDILGIKHGSKRALIQDVTGLAADGEVLLVLGRPGSGCSTLRRSDRRETLQLLR